MPKITITLRDVLVTKRVKETPIRDKGTLNIMIKGCHNDSNWDAIIIYTKIIDKINANCKLLKESFNFSFSPDNLRL